MNLHVELHPATTLALHASPAMIRLAETLALPAVALDDAVESELAENPALERIATDPSADWTRAPGVCIDDLADSLATIRATASGCSARSGSCCRRPSTNWPRR